MTIPEPRKCPACGIELPPIIYDDGHEYAEAFYHEKNGCGVEVNTFGGSLGVRDLDIMWYWKNKNM